MRKAILLLAVALLFGGWTHGRAAQTYFVSNSGNDANNGLSPAAAWATPGHLTSQSFNSGDTIKFDSTSTFSGGILLTQANAPGYLTLTTTAAGQPTFNSGSANCVKAFYLPGMNVNNLKCVGDGTTPTNCGMHFVANSDLSNGVQPASALPKFYLEGPKLTNNNISQYGADGIFISASDVDTNHTNVAGYVWITVNNNIIDHVTLAGYCIDTTTHNGEAGGIHIEANGAGSLAGIGAPLAIFNVQVNNNTLSNITGFTPQINGGPTDQGITFNNVAIGLAQFNLITNIGAGNNACPSGVGIIAFKASFITIQFNEATGATGFGCDGEGFDLDANVQNSVIQYNYSHNNAGAEILGCSGCAGDNTPSNNDIYRFNLIEGGINSNPMTLSLTNNSVNTQVYNNTMVQGASANNKNLQIDSAFSGASTGNFFANNIFYSAGAANASAVAWLSLGGTPAPVVMTGNDYFAAGGGTYQFTVYGTTYTGLAAFQAAGFEKVGASPVGVVANPNLTNPGANTLCGTAPTTGAGWTATCPTAYRLTAASPAGKTHGLNLNTVYGISVGAVDYFGNTVTNTTLPIGAAANQ